VEHLGQRGGSPTWKKLEILFYVSGGLTAGGTSSSSSGGPTGVLIQVG
jgi:hypothetical protein